jgi:hypothetical protein
MPFGEFSAGAGFQIIFKGNGFFFAIKSDCSLNAPISAPVFANGLPGRKKSNQISLVAFVKRGGAVQTDCRLFSLQFFTLK